MSQSSHSRPAILPLGALAGLLILGSATAALAGDWLVTVDGERIETRGAWEVKGRSVQFHNDRGVLTAIPLDAVDLDASRAANEPQQPKAPAPPIERTPVWVLTDQDVGRAPRDLQVDGATTAADGGETTDGAEGSEGEDGQAPESPGTIAVSSWEEQAGDDGLVFTGTIANGSSDIAVMGLEIQAELRDHDGNVMDTQYGRVASTSLSPGASTTFTVDFPGRFGYAEVVFRPAGGTLRTRTPTPPTDEAPPDETPPEGGAAGSGSQQGQSADTEPPLDR